MKKNFCEWKSQKKQDQKKLGQLLKKFAPLNSALETVRKVLWGGDLPIEVSGIYKWKESTFTERESLFKRTKRQHLKRDHFQGTLLEKAEQGRDFLSTIIWALSLQKPPVRGTQLPFRFVAWCYGISQESFREKPARPGNEHGGLIPCKATHNELGLKGAEMKPKLQWASMGVWNFC